VPSSLSTPPPPPYTEKGTNGQLDFFALSLCAAEEKIHVFRYELEMGNQQ